MARPPATTPNAILEAAIRVAGRDGLLATTLDKVAAEAGVTKGGVLYHFASKDELLTRMMEHFAAEVEQGLITRIANDPVADRRWVRAMIDMVFGAEPEQAPDKSSDAEDGPHGLPPEVTHKFIMAMLAGFAANPALLNVIKPFLERMRARVQAEPGGVEQIVTWLAADGLFLWELFGMARQGEPMWNAVVAELRRRSRPRTAEEIAEGNDLERVLKLSS
jgi:AcrR family transcriptional regulator